MVTSDCSFQRRYSNSCPFEGKVFVWQFCQMNNSRFLNFMESVPCDWRTLIWLALLLQKACAVSERLVGSGMQHGQLDNTWLQVSLSLLLNDAPFGISVKQNEDPDLTKGLTLIWFLWVLFQHEILSATQKFLVMHRNLSPANYPLAVDA